MCPIYLSIYPSRPNSEPLVSPEEINFGGVRGYAMIWNHDLQRRLTFRRSRQLGSPLDIYLESLLVIIIV